MDLSHRTRAAGGSSSTCVPAASSRVGRAAAAGEPPQAPLSPDPCRRRVPASTSLAALALSAVASLLCCGSGPVPGLLRGLPAGVGVLARLLPGHVPRLPRSLVCLGGLLRPSLISFSVVFSVEAEDTRHRDAIAVEPGSGTMWIFLECGKHTALSLHHTHF
ncbi:Agamous-like MADS-box protein AGL8 [Zea mays]|jgi:hypothetical protein|uniref:Agamous-like MADS-box protein AGL8 n=1 Tax=Zea mays TaxID=4577 RepID=A0A1D6L4V9_MAIZE|nr:Agamous-like MADS-box protein AGL8 [Zea mays]